MFSRQVANLDPEIAMLIVGRSVLGIWLIDIAESIVGLGESIELRVIVHAPTICVASDMYQRRPTEGCRKVLAIGYSGSDLPGVHRELDSLQRNYGDDLTTVSGEGSTKLQVLEMLSDDFYIIHFAGHRDFDYVYPMKSSLFLSDSGGVDA